MIMRTENDIKNYEHYLELLMPAIDGMFKAQEEYMCCKSGCSLCCEEGEYPFSEMEFEYIKKGFGELPSEIQQKILDNIKSINKPDDCDDFMYKCPFLIDKKCAVYKYRGLICRTFGLITLNAENKLTLPFCSKRGLNYSKVYDTETKMILEKNVEKYGYKTLPKAYNLSRENLMYGLADNLNFEWGETKSLLDWLSERFVG